MSLLPIAAVMARAGELVTRARAALPEAALRTGDFAGVDALLSEALRLAEADGDLRSQADASRLGSRAATDLQDPIMYLRRRA